MLRSEDIGVGVPHRAGMRGGVTAVAPADGDLGHDGADVQREVAGLIPPVLQRHRGTLTPEGIDHDEMRHSVRR